MPGFCEDGKANAGSSREGRPEKDKNIQNRKKSQDILNVYSSFETFHIWCVLSTNINIKKIHILAQISSLSFTEAACTNINRSDVVEVHFWILLGLDQKFLYLNFILPM